MKYNKSILDAVIEAMSYTAKDLAPDYEEISHITHNGRGPATWDRRAQILSDMLKNNPRYEVLTINRGNLWVLSAVLDKKQSVLYIMITDQNLNIRRKKVGKEYFSTHYLYSLLHYNANLAKIEQLELLPLSEEQENYRVKDCEKMLGKWADQVSEVLVASFSYSNGKAISGTLHLFDSQYHEVNNLDLSSQILHPIKHDNDQTPQNDGSQPKRPLIKLRNKTRTEENDEKEKNNHKPDNK